MTSLLLVLASGCGKHELVDAVMAGAYRPDPHDAVEVVRPWVLLSGDLHCHVSPPDNAGHVGRDLPSTVELAEEEGLDFVVLSPHVWDGFFSDTDRRAAALAASDYLVRGIARTDTDVLLVPGFEYSTGWGHATMAFADLRQVLSDLPEEVVVGAPERFFEHWVAQGGVIVVNHPLLTPVDSVVPNARWDLSWRPWTTRTSLPREIATIDRLAHGWEAENSAVSHLRDEYLVGNPGTSRRSVLYQIDQRIPKQRRRMTPIGGSDSHGHHLRAVTFVLAEERSPSAVRDAIVDGRVCIRNPWACTLEARVGGGPWQPVGAALTSEDVVEVRARGRSISILRDGRLVARPRSGKSVRLGVDADTCSAVRARVDGGDSAPIYVNCPFAQR